MLDDVALFVQVVENKGFSRAAEKLGLAVPVVSRRINRLEKSLQAKLLQRTTRQLSLTELGGVLYEGCQPLMEQMQEIIERVADQTHKPTGVLRISAAVSTCSMLLTPFLAEFSQRYPGIELQITNNNSVVNLVEEGLDLAIRGGIPSQASLVTRKLLNWHDIVCASPEYLSNYSKPAKPEDLLQHNCLTYIGQVPGNHWSFCKNGKKETVVVKSNLRLNTGTDLVELAKQGVGIVSLPSFIVQPVLAKGELQALLTDYSTQEKSVYAVLPDNRHIPLKTKVFLDFIAEKLQK